LIDGFAAEPQEAPHQPLGLSIMGGRAANFTMDCNRTKQSRTAAAKVLTLSKIMRSRVAFRSRRLLPYPRFFFHFSIRNTPYGMPHFILFDTNTSLPIFKSSMPVFVGLVKTLQETPQYAVAIYLSPHPRIQKNGSRRLSLLLIEGANSNALKPISCWRATCHLSF
jgi:hypothetical protein